MHWQQLRDKLRGRKWWLDLLAKRGRDRVGALQTCLSKALARLDGAGLPVWNASVGFHVAHHSCWLDWCQARESLINPVAQGGRLYPWRWEAFLTLRDGLQNSTNVLGTYVQDLGAQEMCETSAHVKAPLCGPARLGTVAHTKVRQVRCLVGAVCLRNGSDSGPHGLTCWMGMDNKRVGVKVARRKQMFGGVCAECICVLCGGVKKTLCAWIAPLRGHTRLFNIVQHVLC
jgi:hypothetical protein